MRKPLLIVSALSAISALTLVSAISAAQQPPAPGAPPAGRGGAPPAGRGAAPPAAPRTAKTAAPIDLTGYWVSVVTEDWKWRMLTPAKGDVTSVPVNGEARRVANAWDPAKDEADGLSCKPFGVGGIVRMPTRIHITWQDDDTLKAEFDAGTQTRLLHFGARPEKLDAPSWQGYSSAAWQNAGQALNLDRNGIPAGPSPIGGGLGAGFGGGGGRGGAARGGSLYVATTNAREGYLRKNGVPYSAGATVTEYYDKVGPEPNGDVILLVRTTVDDPKYLTTPFITSTHFKLEKDGAKWNPSPCKIEPPIEPGK